MHSTKKDVKLYNAFFPIWFLMMLPQLWIAVLPVNFIIDSLVLLVSMKVLQVADKKQYYKRHILPVFGFGMLADIIGAGVQFLLTCVFELGTYGDEFYLTVPAVLLVAALIFVFDYFVTFRKSEKPLRLKMALIYAVVTAPYTFLFPLSWFY